MAFQIKNGVLTKYTEEPGVTDVVIPDGVTSIGSEAFCKCHRLTSVIIPEGVTSIGDLAFSWCENLTSITIPEGITRIGNWAFRDCGRLTDVTIPESVTIIGDGAFYRCYGLTDVTIPESVTHVGDYAFSECHRLTGITIPESVSHIGTGVFSDCENLTSATIPASIASIGALTSEGCEGLADASGLVVVNGTVDWCRRNAASVTIPEGVTRIGDRAFSWCKRLTSVVIPEGVTSIGEKAFAGCMRLSSVTIPESVTSIGGGAFDGCESLTGITIPEGVTRIGGYTFSGCTSLTSITIPDGVTSIGGSAFKGCDGLVLSLPQALLGQIGDWTGYYSESSFGLALRDGGERAFLAYSTKENSDNLKDFFTAGAYQRYDLELLGSGSTYRYKLQARLLGMLGRLKDPVNLDGEIRKAFLAVLGKNFKKLLSIAEDLPCPEIVQALLHSGALEGEKEAALRKLLAKSPVPEIAALAKPAAEGAAAPEPGKEGQPLSDVEDLVARLLREEGKDAAAVSRAVEQLYGIKPLGLVTPRKLCCKDGSPVSAAVLAYLFTVHETLEDMTNVRDRTLPDVVAAYEAPGVCPHAAEVLALLDQESLQESLLALADRYLGLSGRSKKMFLAFPICRYADEATMRELTGRAVQWASGVSGNDAPPLRAFRKAVLYSNTRSAIWLADHCCDLGVYAKMRGTLADTLQDRYLYDIGLDTQGGRQYDLGNQMVTARLQPDLSFLMELPGGKTAKSLPKKGADPEKYEAAKADLDQRKKDAKRIATARYAVLFADFLRSRKRDAADWQEAYLHNPLLRSMAKLLVWSQGKRTFTLTESGPVRSDGKPYPIGKGGIGVAHPMEMTPEDVAAWQEYFRANGLKQPFPQIWEPVFAPETVREDRYTGCTISCRRVQNAEKHGVHYRKNVGWSYPERTYFTLDDCELEVIDAHMWDGIGTLTLGKFTFRKYTRKVNHIVYLFDKWTIQERIQKDDVGILAMLASYNAAQITEFLNMAVESKATNLTAALLEYKHTHFPAYDAFAEFTLD